jgi:hypothetical protein
MEEVERMLETFRSSATVRELSGSLWVILDRDWRQWLGIEGEMEEVERMLETVAAQQQN